MKSSVLTRPALAALCIIGSIAGSHLAAAPASNSLFAPEIRRVVFLGDSITYSGRYVAYVSAYQRARFPASDVEILNLGLSSETVSGLSEQGHAGGRFPRPDLHERLARVLEKTKPDLVFACYGMNDGIYEPFDEQRFEAFRAGLLKLRTEVQQAGAKIVHVTPPVFDEVKGGHPGYAEVLDRYSAWLIAQRTNGWDVVDLHFPMKDYLAKRRAQDATFALSRDGIHPDELGHWLMAQPILLHLDAREAAVAPSGEALLAGFPNGDETLRAALSDMARWRDAWLTATGHKRPGVKPGEPIEVNPNTGKARFLTNALGERTEEP